ncbi:hypothetical protein [Mycolicibacter longobardus]|nr:hypothetical protein [Mycolicibacter longobardus]MCV7382903.1 hypothetical protein [Mycolicibacter longobardus]
MPDANRIGLAMVDVYLAVGEFVTFDTGKQLTDSVTHYRNDKKGNK